MQHTYFIHTGDMISYSGYNNLPQGGITGGIQFLGNVNTTQAEPNRHSRMSDSFGIQIILSVFGP